MTVWMWSRSLRCSNAPVGNVAGRPEDVASCYLMAIDNSFMSGAVVDIGGGGLIN